MTKQNLINCPSQINKTIAEVYIEDEVIEPVLAEMAVPIVLEVMQGFVDNMRADLMTEVSAFCVLSSQLVTSFAVVRFYL